jgi:L-ribulose-5-phosphate 3-epimerase
MKFGTRTGVLKQPAEGAFQEARTIGFDGVELDLAREYTGDLLWTPEGRRHLLDLAGGSGVEVSSVCLGALWGQTFAADDEAARQRATEIVNTASRFTPELGTRVILVPIVGVDGQPDATGVERWVEGLRACAPVAESSGVILALENVGRSPANSAPAIAAMLDAVASPAVRVYYDIGNATSLGYDPIEELKLLGDRVAQVHIKGARSAQLWENTLDMAAVARTLREIGYDGYLVFETQATERPSEGAARNLALLKGYIREAYGAAPA